MKRSFRLWILLLLCLSAALFLIACKDALPPESEVEVVALTLEPTASPSPTPTPTASPSPTPTPTPSPSPTPSGLCGGRFYPDRFTSGATIVRPGSYQNKQVDVRVTVTSDNLQTFQNTASYFVVDIYVQDVTLLRTAAARGDFSEKRRAKVSEMAEANDAIVAISGDYYSHPDNNGIVFRNGELYRDDLDRTDICVLYKDGTMQTYLYNSFDLDEILANDPWQIWSFGPALLDENGNAQTDLRTNVGKPNPRCAIGYYEPGHYCFVVVDGRQSDWSWGLTMDDLSLLMHNLGCKVAYNLDGGSTAQLYFEGGIYNRPCHTDREISDIVYIAKATPAPTEEPTETDAP